jgi:poly(hydroxyalkanoate) granule-associated protein
MSTKKNEGGLEDLKASINKIWLAGLGAFAEAEKQGDRLFQSLVQEGRKHESEFALTSENVKESVATAERQAKETWVGIESAIDRQVERALKRLGVATSADVASVKRELAQLRKQVAARPAAKRRKPAPKK